MGKHKSTAKKKMTSRHFYIFFLQKIYAGMRKKNVFPFQTTTAFGKNILEIHFSSDGGEVAGRVLKLGNFKGFKVT